MRFVFIGVAVAWTLGCSAGPSGEGAAPGSDSGPVAESDGGQTDTDPVTPPKEDAAPGDSPSQRIDYRVPSCGRFTPAEEVKANPGLIANLTHGTAGAHFIVPYLAGCTPSELRAQDQVMGFAYEGTRAVSGFWEISEGGVQTSRTTHSLQYAPGGELTRIAYTCSSQPAEDVFTFAHDSRGRLLVQTRERPANCYGPAAELRTETRYTYDTAEFPDLPSTITAGGVTSPIQYLTDSAGRITSVRQGAPGGQTTTREYTYDAAGRVERLSVRAGATTTYSYRYDAEGRFAGRTQEGAPAQWNVTYGANGQLSALTAPGRGAAGNLDFVPVY